MSSELKIVKTSQCNCGQVRITVSGRDQSAAHCYCSNCKRATGSAFAHNHRFRDAELKFESGEGVIKRYADGDTKSGGVLYRHFCGNCGCPMFLRKPAVPDFVALHEGSIIGEKTQPTIELFPEEKYPWLGDKMIAVNGGTSLQGGPPNG